MDLEGLKYNNSKVENRLMDELNGQQHSLMGRCWEKVDRAAEDRANHAVCLLQRGDYPAMPLVAACLIDITYGVRS